MARRALAETNRTAPRRRRDGGDGPPAVDFGPLAGWIGFNLRLAQESAFHAFSRRSQEIGESPGRFATLMLIHRNPGISQTELGQASGRDKSSVTPMIEDLVRRDLVERRRADRDKRTYRLSLTPQGKKVLASLMRSARRHERVLDGIIGARDRKRFLEICRKIATQVE